jgi:hypothetical protein
VGICVGGAASEDSCAVRGDSTVLRPGPGAQRLQGLVERLLAKPKFRSEQCIFL